MTSTLPDHEPGGRLVSIGDTRLYIVERGQGYPVLILHNRPMTFVEENERYLAVVRDFLP